MKRVFNVPAAAALVIASASVSAWWNNNGYYVHAPYRHIAPAMTEEQQKQAADNYAQAAEAQRKAAEAYRQLTAHAPVAPSPVPIYQVPRRPVFQSPDEVIREMEDHRAAHTREMEARLAELHKRRPSQGSHNERAERIRKLEARHAERVKKMEARRAIMQEEMDARRAAFEKAGKL